MSTKGVGLDMEYNYLFIQLSCTIASACMNMVMCIIIHV